MKMPTVSKWKVAREAEIRRSMAELRTKGPWTYFVTDGQYVKIGKANRVITRLSSLQIGCPTELRLLAVSSAREVEWHFRFHRKHHRGEWFRNQDETITTKLIREWREKYLDRTMIDFAELASILRCTEKDAIAISAPYRTDDDGIEKGQLAIWLAQAANIPDGIRVLDPEMRRLCEL